MNTFTNNTYKSLVLTLAMSASCAAYAAEHSATSQVDGHENQSVSLMREGIALNLLDTEIGSTFSGEGIGVSFQKTVARIHKVNLYVKASYLLSESEKSKVDVHLQQAEIVVGANWLVTDTLNVYFEESKMVQEFSSSDSDMLRHYDFARLGILAKLNDKMIVNTALVHQQGDNNDLGYHVALEYNWGSTYSTELGFSHVGDNQSLNVSFFSKF